jgi:mRNA interferase HigB
VKESQQKKYTQAARDLDTWERSARRANWTSLADVRKVYPKADGVTIGKRTYTVFNIAGNRFRLIVQIVYGSRTIFFKRILTHAEYDRDDWRQNLLQEQKEQSK